MSRCCVAFADRNGSEAIRSIEVTNCDRPIACCCVFSTCRNCALASSCIVCANRNGAKTRCDIGITNCDRPIACCCVFIAK